MKHLCDYGCGQLALFFKSPSPKVPNGRHMCAPSPNSCPAKRVKTIGDNNPSRRPGVREKIKEINSVLFASGSEMRKKCQDTLNQKYGVLNPMSIPDVVEAFVAKRRKNNNYKFRFDQNDPAIKEKRAKTRIANGLSIDPSLKTEWTLYEQEVDRLTEQSYKKFKHIINPTDLKRGRTKGLYQLDHIVSKVDGFKQEILPSQLSHPANLRMLPISVNISKSAQSHMSKNDLLESIKHFDLNGLKSN